MRRSGLRRRLSLFSTYLAASVVLISGVGVPDGLTPPASANSVGQSDVQVSAADVDTPVQQTGSAAGLPHLVSAESTKADAQSFGIAETERKPPKGALPLEVRHQVSKEPAKGGLKPPPSPSRDVLAKEGPDAGKNGNAPGGWSSPSLIPAKRASGALTSANGSAAAASSCYYSAWSAISNYSVGATVSYFNTTQGMTEAHDFRATRDPQHSPPMTTTAWQDLGLCYVASQPQPPIFQGFWPRNDALAGSLTPTLEASAYSATGGGVSYYFQICSGPSGPSGSWDWCTGSSWTNGGTWVVPAGKLKWGKSYWWSVNAQDTSNSLIATSSWMTLTPQPEQPSINSLLGSGTGGREFNHVVGNYTQTVTDASVATVGPPLAATRTYNSLDPRTDGMFGAGWSTRWDMRLVDEPQTQTVLVSYPNGSQSRFGAMGDGSYAPPQGTYATLATVTGGGWRLMDKSSASYVFDAQGRVVKVTDNRARAQDLVYGTDGKLAKVTSTGGRSLYFTWSGGHAGSLSTDPVDGAPLSWSYTYDGDKLVKVCGPGSATACTTYAYSDTSRYSTSVLNSVPSSYWRLDEATGAKNSKLASAVGWDLGNDDAFFSSGAYDATVGVTGALGGSADTAVRFAGTSASSSYVSLPDSAISGRGGYLTVEAWFKTTGSGVVLGHSNASSGTPTNFTPVVYVGTDGKLRGQFWNGQANPITSTGLVNNDQWHHVALSGDGSSQTLYLDGQAVGTRSGTIDHRDQFYTRLGSGHTSATWPSSTTSKQVFPYKGDIDEVAIYGRSLPAAEIRAHYQAGVAAPQMTKATLPSGRVWADNAYSADGGRLQTHTDSNGGLWKLSTLQYSEDPEGDPQATITITDPHNGTLVSVHDSLRAQRVTRETDQVGKTTTYEYDTGGYLGKVTDRNGNTTQLFHDDRGNIIGRQTCRASGNCQTAYYSYYLNTDDNFDARNNGMIASRDARSSDESDNTYATTWDYTSYGEVSAKKTPATSGFPSGRSATYSYTDGSEQAVGGGTVPAGLLKSYKDFKGNESTYRYTPAGDLAEGRLPSGLLVKYGYDSLGRLKTRSEISADNPTGVTTAFAYDGLGQLVSHTGAPVKNEVTGVTHTPEARYTYDLDGNKLTDTVVDLTGADPSRTNTYTYDDYGRVETVIDPVGDVVSYTWDHTGSRIRVVNQVGTTFDYAYTARGEIAARTLKNWTGSPVSPQTPRDVVLESYAYDPGGRLASTTDAMGRKRTYTYYNDNQLSQEIADDVLLNGSTTRVDAVLGALTYDAAGNLTRSVDGGLIRTDYVYDAANRLTSETRAPAGRGLKTAYAYDANDNLVKVTRTEAGTSRVEVTDYSYNVSDQLIRRSVENGADDLITTWTVDDRNVVTGVTDPRGNLTGADAAQFTTSFRYDAAAQLVEVKAPQVQVEKIGSVATAQPVSRYGYDGAGRLTHVVDSENRTTVTAYDKADQVISETRPAYTPPGGGATVTPKVDYAYDPAGRLTGVTDARGFSTSGQYDALGNLVRVTDPASGGQQRGQWVTEYDLLGEPLAAVDPTGTRVEGTYDDLGRLITHTQVERKPASAAYTTTLQYNNAGYLTKAVAPGNKTTTYGVNAAGELTSVSDPLGHATTFAYDLAGRTVKVTDPLNNSTTAEYDLAGRQLTAKDLNSAGSTLRTFSYGWDAADNQTSATTPEGYTTHRSYDATNLLVRLVEPVTSSETITTTYGYDAVGALTRTTDGRDNTVWTTYNTLGLAESTVEPSTSAYPNQADRTWTDVYDAAGNAVKLLEPGGVRIERQFDELGRVVKKTGTGADVATPERSYVYDLADRLTGIGDYTLEYNDRSLLTKVSKPSGQVAAYTYDSHGNPTQRNDTTGTATFTWDDVDRLATAAEPISGRSFTYGYDNADRLTSLVSAGPATTQAFTYDDIDRLSTHTLKNGSGGQLAKITYGWNKDDQLTSKATSGTAGAGTNTYGYDQSGRLTSWTAATGNVTAYTWDAAGNRTKAGDQTYVYDERNRLISGGGSQYTYTPRGTLTTETKAGTTRNLSFDAFDRLISDGDATYTYDALGRLSSRVKSGSTQQFTYSGLDNDIASAADGSGTIQGKYGRDPFGTLLALQEAGGPALGVMSDQHGDVVGTFSGTALVDSTAYDPFGQVIAQTGTRRSLGYQGEWTDPETGKVNMNARWYQPGTGGFTSRDDWNLSPDPSGRLNRYSYANGNPLTRIDPYGHCSSSVGRSTQTADFYCPPPPKTEEQRLKEEKQELQKYHGQRSVPNVPTADTLNREKQQMKTHSKPKDKPKPPTPPGDPSDDTPTGTPKKPKSTTPSPGQPKTPKGHEPKYPEPKGTAELNGGGPLNCKADPHNPLCGDNPANVCKWNKYIPGCEGNPSQDAPGPKKNDKAIKPDQEKPVEYDINNLPPLEWEPVGGFVSTVTPQGPRNGTTQPVETIVNKTTDDVVRTIIDNVTPSLPSGSNFGGDPGCGPDTPNSFIAGTPVLMADGGRKPIEDVKIGDQVLAADPATGRVEAKPVVSLIKGDGTKDLVRITIDGDRGAATDTITATDGHPFWLPKLGEWLDAAQLQPGMWLQTSAGTYVQITAIKKWTAHERVYNLTIDDLHTYYVFAGHRAVLVHNDAGRGRVYRVIRPDEDLAVGLKPKDPYGNVSIDEHVRVGSRPGFTSQFISTTRNRDIAESWAARSGNRLVEIDLDGVEGSIIDLSTHEARLFYLLDWKGRGYAMKSEEVLIEGSVPPHAVRDVSDCG
ncbi:polymorphic toxin-type HINT domain-containing protein [Sphaerisporangium sp. NPDC088356]|uniref:polymorphic toxin-type HINT domain-containing protein n=1 Tax=Sphaerisporangium sp. NPDC088356 TaxID=3154871 RepID=UPI0034294C5F